MQMLCTVDEQILIYRLTKRETVDFINLIFDSGCKTKNKSEMQHV